MLKTLVSDQLLLFQLVVANEIAFSLATSYSYDHFFQFPRWLLMRALTVFSFQLATGTKCRSHTLDSVSILAPSTISQNIPWGEVFGPRKLYQ